jgi:coenzyme F420-dependent glucose-6-phosphate dehydrogenase
MRALWTDERVDFSGDCYATSSAMVYDRPHHGVPIYIAAGGSGRRSVRRPIR